MSHSIPDLVTLIKNYILSKDDGVLSIVAPIENSANASQSYAIGKRLVRNRVLYDVIATIDSGDLFVVGTNIAVSNDISDILNTKSKTPTMLTRILLPGNTQITFPVTDTGNVFVDFFTDAGIGYTNITVSSSTNEVTLTFEPQSSNVTVYCLIQEL